MPWKKREAIFCNFLFALQHTFPLLKRDLLLKERKGVCSKGKEFAPQGSRFFPLSVDPFCQNCFFLPTGAFHFVPSEVDSFSSEKETVLTFYQNCSFLHAGVFHFIPSEVDSFSREKETILTFCQNHFFLPTEAFHFSPVVDNFSREKETILTFCQNCFFLPTEAFHVLPSEVDSFRREKETIFTLCFAFHLKLTASVVRKKQFWQNCLPWKWFFSSWLL